MFAYISLNVPCEYYVPCFKVRVILLLKDISHSTRYTDSFLRTLSDKGRCRNLSETMRNPCLLMYLRSVVRLMCLIVLTTAHILWEGYTLLLTMDVELVTNV